MSHKPVRITCTKGFIERGFKDRDAAQRWIDDFARARLKHPELCDGEHTIVEENDSAD